MFHIPGLNGANGMTASSRISAMNIVGDLLRKVGVSDKHLIGINLTFFASLYGMCIIYRIAWPRPGLRILTLISRLTYLIILLFNSFC